VIIQASVLFFLISVSALALGYLRKSKATLFVLSLFWWIGLFVSAYDVYLTWLDRGYSENWAAIGFVYIALPYAALTVVWVSIALCITRRWAGRQVTLLRINWLLLLVFLALQLMVGFLSV